VVNVDHTDESMFKERVMKQVDAVIAIVSGIQGFVPGVKLNDAQRKEALDLVCAGLTAGEIDMSAGARAKHDTEAKMRLYASGLITNWCNKSKELNGGVKYQAKNPGSRSGSEEFKQAVLLKKYLTEKGQDIPEALEQFITDNTPVKTEKVLEVSALPEHLQKLVG
jgi:hypothetical protein